jgi:signal transduction histidine kinase
MQSQVQGPFRIDRDRLLRDEARRFERLIAQLAGAFVRATVDQIDGEINHWLERIGLALGLDRTTVAQIDPNSSRANFSHAWVREGHQLIPMSLDANLVLPWLKSRMLAGETVVFSNIDELPPEAAKDVETIQRFGPKSNVTIPVSVGGAIVGAVGFGALERERKWPPKLVGQLRLIADILGYALERKRSVTESLRLRDELTHVARAATLGELAASLAHELNQPLAAIMNNAEAARLLLRAERPDFEEIGDALQEIAQDNQRASDIIERFRVLFRRGELSKSTLRPTELLDAVERIVASDAAVKNIVLTFDCPAALPDISADRVQLQQVMINLILNAFDAVCAVDPPREVGVSAFSGESGWINVSVRDCGKGIEPPLLPRLFEPFFTTKKQGMGMGLAIARSIVESHGGRLWARQNSERGATFEFALPAQSGL